MNKTSAPVPVIALWLVGGIISAVTLGLAIISGLRECDGNAMCSMSSAIEMMFSVMGVFVGALVVVSGFALRSAQTKKMQDAKYREDMRFIMESLASEPKPEDK